MSNALVVFGGSSCHPLAWMLHEDFQHCFVCVLSEGYWVEIDKVQGKCKIRVVAGADFDLAALYEKNGYKVLTTKRQKADIWRFNPFYGNIMVANCVGVVKAVLSMNSLALTPYQLYKELKR